MPNLIHTIPYYAYSQSLIFSNHSKIEGYRRYLSVDSLTLRRARLAHDRPLLDSLDGITSTKLKYCFKCFSTILLIILSWSWLDTSPTWNQINLKRTLLPFSLPLHITPKPNWAALLPFPHILLITFWGLVESGVPMIPQDTVYVRCISSLALQVFWKLKADAKILSLFSDEIQGVHSEPQSSL